MRGVYRVSQTITGVTTAEPLLTIATPATKMIEILSAKVGSVDEATSEQMVIGLSRATGSLAGGNAITPKPVEEGMVASGCTAHGGDTAITGLTSDPDEEKIDSQGVNKLAGYEYIPLPEERAIIGVSDRVVLDLLSTITSGNLVAEILYREIG